MKSYNYIGDGTSIFTAKEIDKKLLFVSSKLKDHNIHEDVDIYRFHNINYYDNSINICHELHDVSHCFKFPKGMNREDGFKVLSYLIDKCDRTDINPFEAVERIIDTNELGFEKVTILGKKIDDKLIDLFTITGKVKRFKISKYYDKYFNWYIKGVTEEEFEKIYKNINIELCDLQKIKQKCINK